MTHQPTEPVARRRVFYIPGYDPHPARRYRELYRVEGRKQAGISGYRLEQKPEPGDTSWKVRARIDGHQTITRMTVLVWNDLVLKSMRQSIGRTYLQLARTAWIYLSTGTLRRLSWLNKGPVLAALYPVLMLLGQLVLAVLGASLLANLVVSLLGSAGRAIFSLVGLSPGIVGTITSAAMFWAIFLPVTIMALRWFKSKDHKTFAYYLMHDFAYSASKRGAYPDELEARIHEFRHRIEAAMREDIDEVLIVGHSSGAQIAVSVAADLLRLTEGRQGGPALSLMTLGQVIPMMSFLPDAKRLRRDLRLLAASREITWLDVSAPGDGCCFALTDPVAVSGVAPEQGQRWPLIMSAAFSNTLSEGTKAALRHRYFRLHFQYLCAFDYPNEYDYFRITAGPKTLAARLSGLRSSVSRIDVVASRFTSMMR